jgi:hypothetical protein
MNFGSLLQIREPVAAWADSTDIWTFFKHKRIRRWTGLGLSLCNRLSSSTVGHIES